jgi:hypothetical protein
MHKKINGTWYNVAAISGMTFEEFRPLCTGTDDKAKNIYFEITGKTVTTEKKTKSKSQSTDEKT